MRLFNIQNDLIADRTSDAWYRIPDNGPYFHYRWQYGTGPDGEFSYVIGEHRGQAVCKEEPSLTMAWGLEVDGWDDRHERRFDWASNFPDETVRLFWADFFWNGSLIDRVTLASFDGARGVIPLPNYRKEVTQFEAAVALLVAGLEGDSEDYNPVRVLDRIGITIIGDHDREGAGSPR